MNHFFNRLVLLGAFIALSGVAAYAEDNFPDPKLKAGGWEQTKTLEYIPPLKSKPTEIHLDQCTDNISTTLTLLQIGGAGEGGCQNSPIIHNGNTYEFDWSCVFQGKALPTLHKKITVISDDEFERTEQSESKLWDFHTGKFSTTPTTVISRTHLHYIGACKAGMKPGDVQAQGQGGSVSITAKQSEALARSLTKSAATAPTR